MHTEIYSNKPNIQFPVRISDQLHEQFSKVSKSTHIPKSHIARLAISSFLKDIELRGITAVLDEIEGA